MYNVTASHSDGITTIEFSNAGKANALVPEFAAAIAAELEKVDEASSCVVLRGEGRVFCAGVDLEFVRTLGALDQVERTREYVYGSFQRLARAITFCPVPVIGRLQGGAMGAGADLALACDIRIASTSGWLQESWITLGATSALGGAHVLRNIVGSGRALEIFLSARRVAADELLALGLVEQVVPDDELDGAVTSFAEVVAGRDRAAVLAAKELIRGGATRSAWDDAVQASLDHQVELICRPEFRDRVDAVLESIGTARSATSGR
jgi:2-(1,2-epoxy-1,2-dihydrophenyl)acetyl-CoA isomerase